MLMVASAIVWTARSKASALAWDGFVKPLTLRTNCSAASRTSSSVGGGAKFWGGRRLRHMHPGKRPTTGARPRTSGHPPAALLLQLPTCSAVRELGGVHVDVVGARLLQDRVDRALLLAGHASLRRPRRLREQRDEHRSGLARATLVD